MAAAPIACPFPAFSSFNSAWRNNLSAPHLRRLVVDDIAPATLSCWRFNTFVYLHIDDEATRPSIPPIMEGGSDFCFE